MSDTVIDATAPEATHLYGLVVIGCSAGGIEALSRITAVLPADFPAPIVVAQHLDPNGTSHLSDILARRSSLPVYTIVDTKETAGAAAEHGAVDNVLLPGVVYVVPPDRDVEIQDSTALLHSSAERHPKPSIDQLFASAAAAYGERLIAVVLTGTGSDGSMGARSVKAAGGLVLIEKPSTASYPGMPAALAPTIVDMVADLDRIGTLLGELVIGAYSPAEPGENETLDALLAQVRDYSEIDFGQYKRPTIVRRLQRRMAAVAAPTLTTYIAYLRQHPEEYARLVTEFLIQVTEFFRDPELFEYLREQILPDLIADARARGSPELRLWSAGCATGEEAYSLAILLAEVLGDDLERFPVRIFATDVDAQAIAYARRGIYPAAALANVPPALVARYFTSVDAISGSLAIAKRIRGLVVFGEHDLARRAPFPQVDLVLCRNVLIYFTAELQRRALLLFAFALRDGGYLALGNSETTSPTPDIFVLLHPHLKVYRRHGQRLLVPPPQPPRLVLPLLVQPRALGLPPLRAGVSAPHGPNGGTPPSDPSSDTAEEAIMPSRAASQARTSIEQLGQFVLELPIGVVLVDRQYDVRAINSAAYRLLGIYRAAMGEDLLHVVRGISAEQLRAALETAFRATPSDPDAPPILVQTTSSEPRTLRLRCSPLFDPAAGLQPGVQEQHEAQDKSEEQDIATVDLRPEAPGDGGTRVETALHVLLLVEDVTADEQARQARQFDQASRQQDAAPTTVQQLQAEVERLHQEFAEVGAITRELRDANQEIVAKNLALTHANEALAVREEEAQSASEEVKALNEEMQATNEELETMNEEMEATLEELRATNDDAQARASEMQVLAAEREAQRQMSEHERARLSAILLSMGEALLVVNASGAMVLTNSAYDALFGGAASSVELLNLAGDLLPEADTPQRRAAQGAPFRMEFTFRAPDGRQRWFEAYGQPISGDSDLLPGGTPSAPLTTGAKSRGGVVTIRDISDRSLRHLQEQFVSLIVHEIRAPLGTIAFAIELLQAKLGAIPEVKGARELGDMAFRQVQQVNAIIEDLTVLGRIERDQLTLNLQPLDLAALLRRIVSSFAQAEEADRTHPQVVLQEAPPERPVLIRGDAVRLEQIVVNLLTNAFKYASESKQIDLRLSCVDEHADLQVQDYGPGIPRAVQADLFNKYYQVTQTRSKNKEGLGLGLYIARELVRAHGGSIAVASAEGQGTTFTVHFPLLTAAAADGGTSDM